MKMILASFLLSSLAALTTLQAQTIQQLNQPKDAPADVQTQLDLQKQYHQTAASTPDLQLFNHVTLGVTIGLDGFGAQIAAPVTPYFQLRGGYSFIPKVKTSAAFLPSDVSVKLSNSRTIDIPASHKFPFTVDVTSGGPHLLLDIFPGKHTAFHFTVGVYYRPDKQFFNAKVDVSDILDKTEYGGGVYYQLDAEKRETRISADPNGWLHLGVFSQSSVRPYFGIGIGRSVDKESRVSVVFDLGVIYWGKPQVCSVYYGMADPDSPLYRKDAAGNPYMIVPITAEDIKKIPYDDTATLNSAAGYMDTFNDLPVFPMLKLGVFFRIF